MVRLLSHYVPANTLLQTALDACLLLLAVMLGLLLQTQGSAVVLTESLQPAILFALLVTVINGALGLYRHDLPRSFGGAAARIILALLLGLCVLYVVLVLMPCRSACEEALAISGTLSLAAVLLLRATLLHRLDPRVFSRHILVVGTGPEAALVEQALAASGMRGMLLLGFYPIDAGEVAVSSGQILSPTSTLTDVVNDLAVDEIIVAVRERRGGVLPLTELLQCKLEGVSVIDLSTFFERLRGEVRIESLRASWLIYGEGFRQGFVRTIIKRSFDLSGALVLLVVSLPFMLLAAFAIKLESKGPIIYQQERVGQAGRVFRVKKFRSMYSDAEADGKPRWAKANDDRITRVGRFIRKTRIDELPQIFNVLMGEMSIVGPRPERPFFVAQLSQQIPFYAARHSVKPGITGWAQVRYKYGDTVDDAVHKLQFDLYYIKNQTLLLDLLILFRTMTVVLSGEGAH
ncbi:MAG: TIGR03013 family PEP-CTERM/XrtA system glycosyltransferase [Rhodocyclaceae bacterium]|nr:TIGR03013 family PEP-CTERM/XrtA system glycosyltransferase [Rhodocyclaceae bacterium]